MSSTTEFATTATELAGRWQALALESAEWWLRLGSSVGSSAPKSAETPVASRPIAASSGVVDGAVLARLNETYERRWQALWSAITATTGGEGLSALAALAREPVGD